MKSVFVPLILAILLLAAGAVCWTLGTTEERLAAVDARIATMAFEAAGGDIAAMNHPTYTAWIPRPGGDVNEEAGLDRATTDYWLGRYDLLPLTRDGGGTLTERDPQVLLMAANSAYRSVRAASADRQASIKQLETIVKNYADVVKSSPDLADAAYNYEFASRALAMLAHPHPGAASPRAEASTIHGLPGKLQEGPRTDQFKMIVPKQSDERTQQPEAGKGGRKVRKG